jgi:hypothetical protein
VGGFDTSVFTRTEGDQLGPALSRFVTTSRAGPPGVRVSGRVRREIAGWLRASIAVVVNAVVSGWGSSKLFDPTGVRQPVRAAVRTIRWPSGPRAGVTTLVQVTTRLDRHSPNALPLPVRPDRQRCESRFADTGGSGQMIMRIWHGWTAPENADRYQELLDSTIVPGILDRQIRGLFGIDILRRADPNGDTSEVEFVTIMTFDGWAAIEEFANGSRTSSVVPARARELLTHFDEHSQHHLVVARHPHAEP